MRSLARKLENQQPLLARRDCHRLISRVTQLCSPVRLCQVTVNWHINKTVSSSLTRSVTTATTTVTSTMCVLDGVEIPQVSKQSGLGGSSWSKWLREGFFFVASMQVKYNWSENSRWLCQLFENWRQGPFFWWKWSCRRLVDVSAVLLVVYDGWENRVTLGVGETSPKRDKCNCWKHKLGIVLIYASRRVWLRAPLLKRECVLQGISACHQVEAVSWEFSVAPQHVFAQIGELMTFSYIIEGDVLNSSSAKIHELGCIGYLTNYVASFRSFRAPCCRSPKFHAFK